MNYFLSFEDGTCCACLSLEQVYICCFIHNHWKDYFVDWKNNEILNLENRESEFFKNKKELEEFLIKNGKPIFDDFLEQISSKREINSFIKHISIVKG